MTEREKHDLTICMPIHGFGDMDDLDWRHQLENEIDHALAQHDNGRCDGGDIGSGTMNIGVAVHDFDAALTLIAPLLQKWEAPPGTQILRSNLYQIIKEDSKLDGFVTTVVWPQSDRER